MRDVNYALRNLERWDRVCVGAKDWYLITPGDKKVIEEAIINGADRHAVLTLEKTNGRYGSSTKMFVSVCVEDLTGVFYSRRF
jgi:hypothetical protein